MLIQYFVPAAAANDGDVRDPSGTELLAVTGVVRYVVDESSGDGVPASGGAPFRPAHINHGDRMPGHFLRPLMLALLIPAAACTRTSPGGGGADSTFAAMQERGASAMGVDQYSSKHVFEPRPDGGRIVLQRVAADSAGVATIRAHMRDIAARFAAGDFAIPGFVHAQAVPGTDVMAARRAGIRYIADTLPGGGMVTIVTSDPVAVDAVHRFLAFQRAEHHSGMSMDSAHAGHH